MSLLSKLERLVGLEKKRKHHRKPKYPKHRGGGRRARKANGEFRKRKR